MKKTEKLVESKTMVMRGRMTVVSKAWGKGKRKPQSGIIRFQTGRRPCHPSTILDPFIKTMRLKGITTMERADCSERQIICASELNCYYALFIFFSKFLPPCYVLSYGFFQSAIERAQPPIDHWSFV